MPSKDDAANEYHLRAQAFQRAVQKVLAAPESNLTRNTWDVWPVIFLHRQALESRLKAIVFGPGLKYLTAAKPDVEWAHRTHSLRRLQWMASKVLRGAEWNGDELVDVESGLAELTAIVGWFGVWDDSGLSPDGTFGSGEIQHLVEMLSAVIDFLDATSVALAAMWDIRDGAVDCGGGAPGDGGDSLPTTIH